MEEADYSTCSFSLICQEDGAELECGGDTDAGAGASGCHDGLFFMYKDTFFSDAEEEEYMEKLVSKEASSSDDDSSSSAISDDWFRCARHEAIKWILETRAYFGFGHRTAYLAIAYFDRFCLRRRIDKGMPWAARLLSIACASLAAKMEEYRAPALSEFHVDGYEFSRVSVRRMELLVLATLDWRMTAVTPFDYLPYLTSKFRHDGGDGDDGDLIIRAVGFIFATTELVSVLDFRPSTVAAAAILAASSGRLTKELVESKMNNISLSGFLQKEHVYACYSAMSKESNKRAKTSQRLLLGCSESSNPSTYDSVDVIDTASFAATRNNNTKRMRLPLPNIH